MTDKPPADPPPEAASKPGSGVPPDQQSGANAGSLKPRNLVRQGSVVAGMTLLSRISGFVRDVVFSHVFGASQMADAFFVAFRIPNFFRRQFAEGAFSQAFVPVLARYRQQPFAELQLFVSRIFGNLALAVGLLVLIGVFCADYLVVIFAPGFALADAAGDARANLTVQLVQITFPYLGLITLVAFAGSILNSYDQYAVPAFTPALLNFCLITAALIGMSIADGNLAVVAFALAWGVLAAGLAQLLWQLPSLGRLGLLVKPQLSRQDSGVREVGRLLVPAVLAASVAQINTLIDTILASFLISGSISWLYYSDRLLELPVGLVAVTLGTVLLPNLSRLATAERFDEFRAAISWGVRTALLLALPAAVALYVLALPLISSIFFHGAMSATDAQMAAVSLQAFAPGLLGWVLVKVLAPGFFARKDTKAPLRYASVAVAVNVVLNLLLFRIMGHVGLALATSVSGLTNAALLARGLHQQGFLVRDPAVFRALWQSLAAATLMGLGLWFVAPDSHYWLTESLWVRVGTLLSLVVGGSGGFVLLALLFGVRPRDLRFSV